MENAVRTAVKGVTIVKPVFVALWGENVTWMVFTMILLLVVGLLNFLCNTVVSFVSKFTGLVGFFWNILFLVPLRASKRLLRLSHLTW